MSEPISRLAIEVGLCSGEGWRRDGERQCGGGKQEFHRNDGFSTCARSEQPGFVLGHVETHLFRTLGRTRGAPGRCEPPAIGAVALAAPSTILPSSASRTQPCAGHKRPLRGFPPRRRVPPTLPPARRRSVGFQRLVSLSGGGSGLGSGHSRNISKLGIAVASGP